MNDLLLRHRNDGNKSVEGEGSRWKNHLQPFFGYLRATQVTSDLIERHINERMKEHTRSKTPAECHDQQRTGAAQGCLQLWRTENPAESH